MDPPLDAGMMPPPSGYPCGPYPSELPLRSKSGGRSTAATMEFKSQFAANNFVTEFGPPRIMKLE